MAEGESDPVVEEVDVYLSKELAENLYCFQYPVRPGHMPYDDFEYTSARIKPKQKKLELELSLDTKSDHYAKGKGEQIALNVDGMNSTENRSFMSNMMDRQMLTSTNSMDSMAQYAVGVLKGGELHLTPLHSIVQLRPSFEYLDKADSKIKQEKMEVDGGDSQDEEEVKPVTVQMVRHETDQAKARRLASYEYHAKKMAEEQWIHIHHRALDDFRSEREREHLYCQSTDSEINKLVLPPKDYLSSLIPEMEEDSLAKPNMPVNILSMTQLKTMSLPDQVRALLINAKVIRFSQLMSILPGNYDQISVLKALQMVALLVQGCWVVKSEVLYPKDTCSPISGVSAEILCRGRDYVMWRFTQSRCVVRKEVASVTKLQAEDTKEILEQMAKPKVNQGWEFLHDYDKDFVDRHHEVDQRQQMLWQAKFQQISKVLKIPKHETEKKAKGKPEVEIISGAERVKTARSRARSKSSSMSDSSPTKSSSVQNTDLSNHVIDLDSYTPSQQQQPSRIPTMASLEGSTHLVNSTSEGGSSRSRRRSNSTSNTTSTNGGAGMISDGGGGGDLKSELRTFLGEIFREHSIVSVTQMRKMLMLRLTECPPGHVLGSGVTDQLLEECAEEIGGTLLQVAWPPQYNDVPDKRLFCKTALGESQDKFRGVILDLFRENFKVRKTHILEQCKEMLGEEPPNKAEFDRILRTVCVFKGSHWYLKGTVPNS